MTVTTAIAAPTRAATAAAATRDGGRVRLGGFGPLFERGASALEAVPAAGPTSVTAAAAATRDGGRVRLGGFGPLFDRGPSAGA
jgi:uncharacterized membrane protein